MSLIRLLSTFLFLKLHFNILETKKITLVTMMYVYTLFNNLLKLIIAPYFMILQVVFEVFLPDAKCYPLKLQLLNLIHDLMFGWST